MGAASGLARQNRTGQVFANEAGMLSRSSLNRIVSDEGLVRGLGDAEARMLVEWLVDRAEEGPPEVVPWLCRRARAVGRFVQLWCHRRSPAAATQLAAVEGFTETLPEGPIDPCTLIQTMLEKELRNLRAENAKRDHRN